MFQSSINKSSNYEIVCIGNYAAIVADRMYEMHNTKYTVALLQFKKSISQPSISGLGSVLIKIDEKPRGADIFKQKVRIIIPSSKTIILENNKKLTYKFLIYGKQNYKSIIHKHILQEALQNFYSGVYSNLNNYSSLNINLEGVTIFYVPQGPGKFRDNFPFLQLAYEKRNNLEFKMMILLEGDSFYPHCHQAHQFLQETLQEYKVHIIYGVKLIKIDYLRRRILYEKGGENRELIYETFYCYIRQEYSSLLKKSKIDPFNCNHRLIHNREYDSIYVIGADIFPTTMSRESCAIQIHHTVLNISKRLQKIDKKQNMAILSTYDGRTSFQIRINRFSSIRIQHSYDNQSFSMSMTGCLKNLFKSCIQEMLTKQYFNFKNYGRPHYFWPIKQLQSQSFQRQPLQQSQNVFTHCVKFNFKRQQL